MRQKLLKQTWFCILIVLALLISKNSNVMILERGADTVMNQIAVNYTVEDIKSAAKKGVVAAASIPSKVNETVSVMTGKAIYGEPIDSDYEGNETSVYAVGSGQVTAVGENEEIGRYVKITHGSSGESLYGNLKKIFVKVPAKVKKGEIIAVYEKKEGKEFYYSFKEFN